MNNLDTLIIGTGFTGLILAHRLRAIGQNVAIVEARDILGGGFSRQALEFIPGSDINHSRLEWLRSWSPTPFALSLREHRPQIFEEGRFRPFVGMGEENYPSWPELEHLNHPFELKMEPGPSHVLRGLIEQLPIVSNKLSEVTSMQIKDGRVEAVIINGQRELRADRIVFTGHPTQLVNLFTGTALADKHLARVARMSSWTALILELVHPTLEPNFTDLTFFRPSGKDFEPVLGHQTASGSRWMTLIGPDADETTIGQSFRHLKRQLKRPWPNLFDGVKEEKIFVLPKAYGHQNLKTKDPLQWPEVANLWLASQALANTPDLAGSLELVEALASPLTGHFIQLPAVDPSC